MKYRIVLSVACLLFLKFTAFAQTGAQRTLTLKECVETAIQNNLEVRQTDLQMQAAAVNLKQAKANLLPDLFANLGHGFNQGRSIDPFTNQYINQEVLFGNYSVSSAVTLFNGFQLKNLIRQNSLTLEANKMDLQQRKENLTLNVILAYLQILTNQEQLVQSTNQADVTRRQVERLTTMNEAGAIVPALLYDLRGQLANEELNIINSRNAVNSARLTLSQLMNIPYDQSLAVEKLTLDQFDLNYAADPRTIFENSSKELALIKAADLRKQSAGKGVQVARGLYYPSVGLSGSFNTNYSNAAMQNTPLGTVEVPSSDYVNVGGNKVPVVTQRTNFSSERISYFNQFNNNRSTSLFLSVRVPIFNRFRAKNQVALAKIDLQSAEVAAATVRNQLNQNIEQAYFNMTAAQERYKTLQGQVSDFAESFRVAEVRFNAGAITQVDYLIAKNNVDRSRINLISARYDYLFRAKILDYYQGRLGL